MIKHVLATITAAALSLPLAAADYYLEADFTVAFDTNLIDDSDYTQPGFTARVGYNFNEETDQIQHKAEAFYGFGFGDTSVSLFKVELDNYYGIAYRPTYKLDDEWSLFARLSAAKAKTSVELGNLQTEGTSDTEFGYGIGASFRKVHISIEDIDSTKFFNVGYSFTF